MTLKHSSLENKLKKILSHLASDGSYLYVDLNFHIYQSNYVDSFGGTGHVLMTNDIININLWLDRDRLFYCVQGACSTDKSKWHDLDIIHTLLTGEGSSTELKRKGDGYYFRKHHMDIQELFSKNMNDSTEANCLILNKQRPQSFMDDCKP